MKAVLFSSKSGHRRAQFQASYLPACLLCLLEEGTDSAAYIEHGDLGPPSIAPCHLEGRLEPLKILGCFQFLSPICLYSRLSRKTEIVVHELIDECRATITTAQNLELWHCAPMFATLTLGVATNGTWPIESPRS